MQQFKVIWWMKVSLTHIQTILNILIFHQSTPFVMKVRECVENSKNQVYNNYPNTSLKVNLKNRFSFYLTTNGTRRLGINWPSWLKITGWPRRRGRRSSCRRWGSDWICKLNNRDFSYILGGCFEISWFDVGGCIILDVQEEPEPPSHGGLPQTGSRWIQGDP